MLLLWIENCFVAYRVNSRTELVFDPEVAGGKGFGNVTAIAGLTNGEIPRVASATPTPYVARGYVFFMRAGFLPENLLEVQNGIPGGRRRLEEKVCFS